jgi:hypothetical protein
VDVLIGSKCHCGRSELGRFVHASYLPLSFRGKNMKMKKIKKGRNCDRKRKDKAEVKGYNICKWGKGRNVV